MSRDFFFAGQPATAPSVRQCRESGTSRRMDEILQSKKLYGDRSGHAESPGFPKTFFLVRCHRKSRFIRAVLAAHERSSGGGRQRRNRFLVNRLSRRACRRGTRENLAGQGKGLQVFSRRLPAQRLFS